MRPLYLSVKGFGPYLKVEIPEETFKLIHQERLFLISGEIGAGKTTLFDAILFSLFGEATFPERAPKDLISHLLKRNPQIIPEVSFKFFFHGKTYQIVRRPPYGRYNASVSLWINDILFSQRASEVSQKIKELFGLEAKQFKKIFLIPQGEYREIILSEPKERKLLFEKLFDTEFLTRLENFFKEKVKTLKEKISSLEEKEKEILNLSGCTSLEDLEEKISKISSELLKGKKELNSLSEKLNHLEERVKNLERGYQLLSKFFELKRELAALRNEEEEIKALKIKIEKLKTLKENLYHYETVKKLWLQLKEKKEKEKTLLNFITEIKEKISEVKRKLEALREKEGEIEKLRELLFKKEEALKRSERIEKVIKELETLSACLKDRERTLEELEKKEKAIRETQKKLIEEKEQFKIYFESERLFSELKEKERELKLYQESLKEYENLLREREALEKKKRELKESLELLEKKALAVKLAENLKEGEPCPVCGSRNHPNKAKGDLFLFGVDSLKRELEKIEDTLEKVKSLLSRKEGEISLLKKKVPAEEGLFYQHIKELEEKLESFKNLFFSFKDLESYEKKERELNREMERLLLKKEETQKQYLKLKEEKGTLEGELKALKNFHSEVVRLDEKNLKREIAELKALLRDFEENKQRLEERLKELEKNLTQKETELVSLRRELKEKVLEYKNSLKALKALIKMGVFENFSEISLFYKELEKLKEYEDRVFSFEERLKVLSTQGEELGKEIKALSFKAEKTFFEELKKTLEILNQEKSKLSQSRDYLLSEITRKEELLKNLERYKELFEKTRKEKKALQEEYPYLEKIFQILSGGTSKISFHSYALSKYLSLILRRANYYLSDFTLGRYRFVEGEIFTKQFILEVFDNFTGTKREARTLSGGESFLASLAFALGAADVLLVLSKKGPLETLLIDEGFGSLDENSLERVIQGLLQVSQKTGKIVGIISHLKELKERFPLVLEIIKNKEKGSQIKLWRNF